MRTMSSALAIPRSVKRAKAGDIACRRNMRRSALSGGHCDCDPCRDAAPQSPTWRARSEMDGLLHLPALLGRTHRMFRPKYGTATVKYVTAARCTFAPSPVSARHSTPHCDRLISLVDSIRLVLFLIVPVGRNGGSIDRHHN